MDINWKFYFSLDLWSEHQGACLLFNIDPTWLIEHEQVQNKFIRLSGATRLSGGPKMDREQAQQIVDKIEDVEKILNHDAVAGIIIPDDVQLKIKADPFDYSFPTFATYSEQKGLFF